MMFGVIYFYFHPYWKISILGTLICMIIGFLISFLFVFSAVFLVLFELGKFLSKPKIIPESKNDQSSFSSVNPNFKDFTKLLFIGGFVIGFFVLINFLTGFNYVEAFIFASQSENPDGFMLFVNPEQYFVTRAQNLLDILFFLGPILVVIAYHGILMLHRERNDNVVSKEQFILVLVAFISLMAMFLTGAPKKGETARICMFILPFVLLPILKCFHSYSIERREKLILLGLVFMQSIVLQSFGSFVW